MCHRAEDCRYKSCSIPFPQRALVHFPPLLLFFVLLLPPPRACSSDVDATTDSLGSDGSVDDTAGFSAGPGVSSDAPDDFSGSSAGPGVSSASSGDDVSSSF